MYFHTKKLYVCFNTLTFYNLPMNIVSSFQLTIIILYVFSIIVWFHIVFLRIYINTRLIALNYMRTIKSKVRSVTEIKLNVNNRFHKKKNPIKT